MSTAKTNLKRRITRFNKAYPHLRIDIPDLSTKRQFNIAERALTRGQTKAKFERQRAKTLTLAQEYGIKVNASKIRGTKTLNRLQASVKAAKSFSIAQKKFVERVTAYNNAVHNGLINKDGDKFHMLPRSLPELKEARRVLNKLEKAEVQKARDMLGVQKGKRLSTHSIALDKLRAEAADKPTLQEFKYWQTAIREVESSAYPELGHLFKLIGWKGVNELSNYDFTISDFAESQTDAKDYNPEYIRDTLDAIAPNLPPSLRVQVQTFLKDN